MDKEQRYVAALTNERKDQIRDSLKRISKLLDTTYLDVVLAETCGSHHPDDIDQTRDIIGKFISACLSSGKFASI